MKYKLFAALLIFTCCVCSSPHAQTLSDLYSSDLSLGGATLGVHSEFGSDVPFIGALGYSRQYTEGYKLGWLGTVEYGNGSWGGSVLGFDSTEVNVEIFIVSGMIASDIRTESGVFVFGGGIAFAHANLGVSVDFWGSTSRSSDELNAFSPTALIAYTFHTQTNHKTEGALSVYARYQGEGIMFGIMLGGISF